MGSNCMCRHRRLLALASLAWIVVAPTVLAQPQTSAATSPPQQRAPDYLIGPGDTLQIFVWRNPDLSVEAPVRPDGRITAPLVQDIQAQGLRPADLADNLREELAKYVQDPTVSVLVKTVAATNNSASIRVIGAAVTPKAVPYRAGLTALDVLIEVGGLNPFANGNGARLLRQQNGAYQSHPLRLKDLVTRGDLRANVDLMPGDIIRIPERMF